MEPLLVVEPGLTVTPVEPELEPEQEPGDLSSSGPGPGQMESGEVGERNSSGIWRCFCIRRLAEEEEDLHTGCGYTGHTGHPGLGSAVIRITSGCGRRRRGRWSGTPWSGAASAPPPPWAPCCTLLDSGDI